MPICAPRRNTTWLLIRRSCDHDETVSVSWAKVFNPKAITRLSDGICAACADVAIVEFFAHPLEMPDLTEKEDDGFYGPFATHLRQQALNAARESFITALVVRQDLAPVVGEECKWLMKKMRGESARFWEMMGLSWAERYRRWTRTLLDMARQDEAEEDPLRW